MAAAKQRLSEEVVDSALREIFRAFFSKLPPYEIVKSDEKRWVPSNGSNEFYEQGVFIASRTNTSISNQVLLRDRASSGEDLLNHVRDALRKLAKLQSSKCKANVAVQNDLNSIFAVTGLLRNSGLLLSRNTYRKIAETRLQALRISRSRYAIAIRDECRRLVQCDPHFAPSRLQSARALLELGLVGEALSHSWLALLVCDKESFLKEPGLERQALHILSKCASRLGPLAVRLDVVMLQNHAGNPESVMRSRGPLSWKSLTSNQKARHQRLAKQICPQKHLKSCLTLRESEIVAVLCQPAATKLMPGISVLVPNLLLISSAPRGKHDLSALASLGVTCAMTMTAEIPMPRFLSGSETDTPLRLFSIPIIGSFVPTADHAEAFFVEVLFAFSLGGQVLLSCENGKGLSGTLSAAFLMVFGFGGKLDRLCHSCLEKFSPASRATMRLGSCKVEDCGLRKREPELTASQAIRLIRALRPGSIESYTQEKFLKIYAKDLQHSYYVDQSISPPCRYRSFDANMADMHVLGKIPKDFPKLIVLCGLPGSGKSLLSERLIEIAPHGSEVVSQALTGSRNLCENLVAEISRRRSRACAIVNFVNSCQQDRMGWLMHASKPINAMVIHLCKPFQHCDANAIVCGFSQSEGCSGQDLRSMYQPFIPPGQGDLDVGFSCIVKCEGQSSTKELLSELKWVLTGGDSSNQVIQIPNVQEAGSRRRVNIQKFPRTRHLLDLGGNAVTRDDLVLAPPEVNFFLRRMNFEPISATVVDKSVVTVEEKLDGANIGFTVDHSRKILAQNRSHYIDEASHPQFKGVRSYIRSNEAALKSILGGGLYILYGEWLYAKHSIHYTCLPSYFIAFDLFDSSKCSFLSRSRFDDVLQGSGIETAPRIPISGRMSLRSLGTLAGQTQSSFYPGVVEGCILRLDHGDILTDRVKIVRPDFLPGNKHWTKAPLQVNQLERPQW